METAGVGGKPEIERGVAPARGDQHAQIAEVAEKALVAIHRFLAKQTSVEELCIELRQTGAADLLSRLWGSLARDPEAAPALEILQLVAFLPDQASYQVARYGASSLADDRDQLLSALGRLLGRG